MQYFEARNVGSEMYENAPLPHYYKKVLEGLDKGANILDFGCGFGQVLNAIKTQNFAWNLNRGGESPKIDSSSYKLYGIDINKPALSHCKSLGLEVEEVNDILSYYPKEKFDLIITTHCLEHLDKASVIPILKHFKDNLLKENGAIFIAVPNAQSATGCYWAYEDFTHNTLFTAGSLIYVLKMAGFKNIEIIDKDALEGSRGIKRLIKIALLKSYKMAIRLLNLATNSSFHAPSPQVFSYEIKALAK